MLFRGIVNYVKGLAMKTQLFQQLCADMDSTHETLLFYYSIRWLSGGKLLKFLHPSQQGEDYLKYRANNLLAIFITNILMHDWCILWTFFTF